MAAQMKWLDDLPEVYPPTTYMPVACWMTRVPSELVVSPAEYPCRPADVENRC